MICWSVSWMLMRASTAGPQPFHHADDSAHPGISLGPRTTLREEAITCTY
jgi:hypothetical protein